MNILTALTFLLLAASPMFIALRYGDRLLDRFARKRRLRRRKTRHKKTRALPIRSNEIERLIQAEQNRDDLDERIATNLEAFARLPQNPAREQTESVIEEVEQDILAREAKFNAYLDYAWLQSETVELLAEEARLLREIADLPREGLPLTRTDPPASPRAKSSSDKLFANLQDAMDRKSKADRALGQVGKPPSAPGSRFDAIIGDESDA